ncbi:MAG TPA: hypothetical protein VLP43_03545 [Solirubrobacteraceae bacterium]|nr:hypothetical protein [Solirubrobacteraceae bacterium]
MLTGLITLPLRLGLRSAQFALTVSGRAVGVAWSAVETFMPGHGGSAPQHAAERPFPRERESAETSNGHANGTAPVDAPVEDDAPARDPRAEFELGDPRVLSREAPPEPEVRASDDLPDAAVSEVPSAPEHLDTELTLVESFAEAGAEDGAGAQIRIEEPWEGYGELPANDVIARLKQATAVELAGVQLFEASSKQRTTVLNAVERQLKARTASAERSTGNQG